VKQRPPICVVGGGIMGLAVARDLALRGLPCMLIERGQLGGETTTHCVGHLHSGARYAVASRDIAAKCLAAQREVCAIAGFAVSGGEGLFVSLDSHPAGSAEAFATACHESGIPIRWLPRAAALALEPRLGPRVLGAFVTPDRRVNPYALVESHRLCLRALGVTVRAHCRLVRAERRPAGTWAVHVADQVGRRAVLVAGGIVNAAGPWAPEISAACGASLEAVRIQGGSVVLEDGLCSRVVSSCTARRVGDVAIPSGRRTLVGSTWKVVASGRAAAVAAEDVDAMLTTASGFLPVVRRARVLRTYSGVRLQLPGESTDGRPYGLVPDVRVVEHVEQGERSGLVTAVLGKLTLFNHGARAVVDALLRQQGLDIPSRTHAIPLPVPHVSGRQLAHAREVQSV
jgi:glycerol-3-phosphate dehydrogenase